MCPIQANLQVGTIAALCNQGFVVTCVLLYILVYKRALYNIHHLGSGIRYLYLQTLVWQINVMGLHNLATWGAK